ncbi:hypothetical protein PHYSODRAFT_298741 [Phytophthora sojae]|uniref:Protein kinase domain-containing protein n=1 Tax=Phytophthora sojae (strain P6497) TaxID=1094619 RepID=G4Z380_PHYSP|nr:hypothetical protein PHYSODRAFT_298741 [Phytophthora sojae]EGZ20749.1 hypothetical protein PHYSODRAFT_298741 [Phytophthora sojae]|eukprot:XP_009523466.1 hypothetical protein PHYSODRAFT_298741 [Phytophthora sojae]
MTRYVVERFDVDVNAKNKDEANAVRLAADGGYHATQRILTRFLIDDDTNGDMNFFHDRLTCCVPPSEIELTVFSPNGGIGADFQAKWLDADAVVKLFIPDAAHSSFNDERNNALAGPEVLRGGPPSFKSDVYALAMCIMAAREGDTPWGGEDDEDDESYKELRLMKLAWVPEREVQDDGDSDSDCDIAFVIPMCYQDPQKRASLSSVVYELERLAAKESSEISHPELEPADSFDDYALGQLHQAWVKLQSRMETCDNVEYCRAFDQLKMIQKRMQEATHYRALGPPDSQDDA